MEKVNPAYTSQTCPKCGHTEKANRNKKIHLFCCRNCGYKSNDDRIGAMKKVNPAYTSQTCPKCGHTEKANRNKKIHLFCCRNCGYKSNDDRIGAMNLYRMGINLLVPNTVAME